MVLFCLVLFFSLPILPSRATRKRFNRLDHPSFSLFFFVQMVSWNGTSCCWLWNSLDAASAITFCMIGFVLRDHFMVDRSRRRLSLVPVLDSTTGQYFSLTFLASGTIFPLDIRSFVTCKSSPRTNQATCDSYYTIDHVVKEPFVLSFSRGPLIPHYHPF